MPPSYLQLSVHHGVNELTKGITKWTQSSNESPKPFIWTKSADEIFASMQKYLEPIVIQGNSEQGHWNMFFVPLESVWLIFPKRTETIYLVAVCLGFVGGRMLLAYVLKMLSLPV